MEYDGGGLSGWQRQEPGVVTVQALLEEALARVAGGCEIKLTAAGRTDAGVHAGLQVAHFDAPVAREVKAWVDGGNANLPPAVRLRWARPVGEDFDARRSALWRRYRYLIADATPPPALLRHCLAWHVETLDAAAMNAACAELLGERDFSAFRAAGCQSSTPMRRVEEAKVERRGALLVVDVRANAFLKQMMRIIVGSLLEIGRGQRPSEWLGELLRGADRSKAAATAEARGLHLVDIGYEARHELPRAEAGPAFLL